MKLSEMFLQRLVRSLLRGKIDEIYYLGSIRTTESSHTMIKLSEAGSEASDGKLSLFLCAPDTSRTRGA